MADRSPDHEGFPGAESGSQSPPSVQNPPGWYPDPHGRQEYRWWGGAQWGEDGGGTLFTEPVLVVGQGAGMTKRNAESVISDQQGRRLGSVRQLPERRLRRLMQWLGTDPSVTRRRQVVDGDGQAVLALVRPAAWWKPRVVVSTAAGHEVGRVVQQSAVAARPRVALEGDGHKWGEITRDRVVVGAYNVRDETGVEIACVYRLWKQRSQRRYTTDGQVILQFNRSVQDPLRTLVVSTAVALDLVVTEGGSQLYRPGVMPASPEPADD